MYEYNKKSTFYFLGIGGISMSALAQLLAKDGYAVSGYDDLDSEQTLLLRKSGIEVHTLECNRRAIDGMRSADVVVYTDAIRPNHDLYLYALKMNKTMIPRSELLGKILKTYPRSIAVAGTHGKTTCTAMCAHVLKSASAPFCAHIKHK